MRQETYQHYVEEGLMAINAMILSSRYDLFRTPVNQAWQLFCQYVETQPMSSLNSNYSYYGSRFQGDLPSLWPAFQYEMARSFGLV